MNLLNKKKVFCQCGIGEILIWQQFSGKNSSFFKEIHAACEGEPSPLLACYWAETMGFLQLNENQWISCHFRCTLLVVLVSEIFKAWKQ